MLLFFLLSIDKHDLKYLQYKIKVKKFHDSAANGLATEAFQKCICSQFDPVIVRELEKVRIGKQQK